MTARKTKKLLLRKELDQASWHPYFCFFIPVVNQVKISSTLTFLVLPPVLPHQQAPRTPCHLPSPPRLRLTGTLPLQAHRPQGPLFRHHPHPVSRLSVCANGAGSALGVASKLFLLHLFFFHSYLVSYCLYFIALMWIYIMLFSALALAVNL